MLECPNIIMKSIRWFTSCKIHISYDIRVLKRCSSRYLVPNAQPTLLPDLPDSPDLRDFRWVHTPLMNLSNVLNVLGGRYKLLMYVYGKFYKIMFPVTRINHMWFTILSSNHMWFITMPYKQVFTFLKLFLDSKPDFKCSFGKYFY